MGKQKKGASQASKSALKSGKPGKQCKEASKEEGYQIFNA
jgi:hypothetical protein